MLALMAMMLLVIFLSGCTKTYFYRVTEEEVHYDSGSFSFYIFEVERTIELGKTIQFNEDSVYSDYEVRALRLRNVQIDTSKYSYLSLISRNYSRDKSFVFQTYLIADSIKITPKPPHEFPKYDGLEPITVGSGSNSNDMWIEPILVPKEYKDDFEIEYILSIYKENDSSLLVRKPIKLKVEYKSHTYSPFIQGT